MNIPPSLLGEERARNLVCRCLAAPPGDIAEVGVFMGGTAFHLMDAAKIQNRRFHLFDTFCGMPLQGEEDPFPVGSFDIVREEDVRSLLPDAIFHVGVFPETIDDTVNNLSFVHVDCDTYKSIKDTRLFLWDRVNCGGIIYFDDMHFNGVKNGLKEFFPDFKVDVGTNMAYIVKNAH